MLWIIAAVACVTLLAGIGFLFLAREPSPPSPAPQMPPSGSHGHVPSPARVPAPSPAAPSPAAPSAGSAGPGRVSTPGAPPMLDEDPGGTTLGVIPAAGMPIQPTPSEELDVELFSQELWFEDDEPSGPVPRILVSASGGTHVGRKREHNEDAFLVAPQHELYAIADGMGGYAAGEVAAAIAVETLRNAFDAGDFGAPDPNSPRRGAELMAAIRRANARIRQEAATDPNKAGMGTTVVSARFSPGRKRAYIAHVGDSRCYRIRDGEIRQLTVDHTLGNLGITGKAAHKLSRAVGTFENVEVELTIDEPQPGDFYLLCSDGLYKMVSDEMILDTVARFGASQESVDALIAEANERGGRDNVTVVLVRVDEPNYDPGQSGEHRVL